jgi:hypothetical protein
VQGSKPRACRLGASGVRKERKQHARDATRRGGPAGGYAAVPTMFLQHTRVSRGSSTREQENPEVREGVGIANQFGPISFSHKSTMSSSSYSSPIVQARQPHLEETPGPPSSLFDPCMPKHRCRGKADCHRHGSPRGIFLRPSTTHCNPSRQASSSPTESHHRRALLIANPVCHGNSLSTRSSPQPRLPQGLP